jgi:hypothetical protein
MVKRGSGNEVEERRKEGRNVVHFIDGIYLEELTMGMSQS